MKIYSKGEWVEVCSGNHDDEESDDPSPTPPDPQPPETVTLVSIAVSGQTTSYQVGDTFSFDGTCTATYSDDSQQTITPTSVSTPSMSTSGNKTITVSYTENGVTKTTTYTISVTAPVVKTASFIAILRTVKNATTGKDTEVTYDSVEKGTVITYKVTIQNNGNVNLTGGKVTSTLPDVQDITFTFNPGGGSSYTYTHTVTQADVDTGFINNQITASAKSAESGVANPANVTTSKDITTIAASPSLTITKSANAPFTITTGTGIPYTITVKNTGNVTLASGVVADSKFVIPNNTFTSLVPGISKSFTYTYTATQADINAGKIENTATASNIIATRGTNPSNISATKTIIIPGQVTPVEPEYVVHDCLDLETVSKTIWATMNMDATDPADFGNMYAWGELEPKSEYTENNYRFYKNGDKTQQTKYCCNADYWAGDGDEPDNLTKLKYVDDVALQQWGTDWCIPTSGQLSELLGLPHRCEIRNFNGKRIIGVKIGNRNGVTPIDSFLFLPVAEIDGRGDQGTYTCYYQSSTNYKKTDFEADVLYIKISEEEVSTFLQTIKERHKGLMIRPIRLLPATSITSVSILNESNQEVADIQLSVNESIILHTKITPSAASTKAVKWYLSSYDYHVTYTVIDESHVKVTGISEGTNTLSCKTVVSGKYASCTITVVSKSATPINPIDPADFADVDNMEHDYKYRGLANGLLFATTNLGAANPEEFGDLISWGEIYPKLEYAESNYKFYKNGNKKQITKYCSTTDYWAGEGEPDNFTILKYADDAVFQRWGQDWIIPKSSDMSSLLGLPNSCEIRNFNGKRIIGLSIGNRMGITTINDYLFLPVAEVDERGDNGTYTCYYLGRDKINDSDYRANTFYISISNKKISSMFQSLQDRHKGFMIRPIRRLSVSYVARTTYILNSNDEIVTNIQMNVNDSIILHSRSVTESGKVIMTYNDVTWSVGPLYTEEHITYTVIDNTHIRITAISKGTNDLDCRAKIHSDTYYTSGECTIIVV